MRARLRGQESLQHTGCNHILRDVMQKVCCKSIMHMSNFICAYFKANLIMILAKPFIEANNLTLIFSTFLYQVLEISLSQQDITGGMRDAQTQGPMPS